MKDEIKEILDFDFESQGERIEINEYERDILKDYITNLQEEYKKSCETYQQALDETMSEKMDLEKENERLTAESTEWESKCYKYQDIINELEKWLEEEQDRLARECSHIYEDSLGKTKLVNEDIFNEITKIKNKLKELKEQKKS